MIYLKDKFEEFLKKEHLTEQFEFNKEHHCSKQCTKFGFNLQEFVNNAFLWEQTDEGEKYWSDINLKWKTVCGLYLKDEFAKFLKERHFERSYDRYIEHVKEAITQKNKKIIEEIEEKGSEGVLYKKDVKIRLYTLDDKSRPTWGYNRSDYFRQSKLLDAYDDRRFRGAIETIWFSTVFEFRKAFDFVLISFNDLTSLNEEVMFVKSQDVIARNSNGEGENKSCIVREATYSSGKIISITEKTDGSFWSSRRSSSIEIEIEELGTNKIYRVPSLSAILKDRFKTLKEA